LYAVVVGGSADVSGHRLIFGGKRIVLRRDNNKKEAHLSQRDRATVYLSLVSFNRTIPQVHCLL